MSLPGRKIKIALDAMGGDHAPREIIEGAICAARELSVEIILVGSRAAIERESGARAFEIVDTPEVIHFTEQPASALKDKPRASIKLICELVRAKQADAAVTMGHTGAAMVAAILTFGKIPGVYRPAIPVPYLGLRPDTIIVDAGANVDCKPEYLVQFAVMGSTYLERVRGLKNPTVALLTNGREDNKGNELTRAAFAQLKIDGLNFIGNVEGYDLPRGTVNVVVCDGMWGNIALKVSETLGEELIAHLQARIEDAASREILEATRLMMDYAEIGAMPLLGIDGLCLIGHGRSRSSAVVGGIRTAMRAIENDLVGALREGFVQ
jgi:phosphate acyltransferase